LITSLVKIHSNPVLTTRVFLPTSMAADPTNHTISRVVKPHVDCWLIQPPFSQEQQFVTGAVTSYRNRVFGPTRPIAHQAGLLEDIVAGAG
jgi:hypothetical protein